MTAHPTELAKFLLQRFDWFCPRLLKVAPKAGGLRVPFAWNAAQVELNRRLEAERQRFGMLRSLIPKARQMGVSAYLDARFFCHAVTQPGTNALVAAHRSDVSSKLFQNVKAYLADMPSQLRPHIAYSNAYELIFDRLGSRYRVMTAGGEAIGRGDTFQRMHLSEVAFFENAADVASGLMRTVGELPGTEIALESTGNGQSGMFYGMCKQAQKDNNEGPWRVHFLPWTLLPEYRVPDHLIPEGWKAPREFEEYARQHRLIRNQIYWYWVQNYGMTTMNGGTPDVIHRLTRQEYPITLEECFLQDSTFAYFPPSRINEALGRRQPPMLTAPKILGVDPSIDANDPCFIADRQGSVIGGRIWGELKSSDPNVQADWIVQAHERFNFDAIAVDSTGLGLALLAGLRLRFGNGDAARRLVLAVNFGAGATKPTAYGNRRAEIIDLFNHWLCDDATGPKALPQDTKLAEEAAAFEWGPGGCRRDETGRLYVTPKEKIRKEIGRSCDRIDACALTFAVDTRIADRRH